MNCLVSFLWFYWDGLGFVLYLYKKIVFRWYEFKGLRLYFFLRIFRIRKICF